MARYLIQDHQFLDSFVVLLASTIATDVDNNHAAEDGQQRDSEQAFQQRETAITRAMGHGGG